MSCAALQQALAEGRLGDEEARHARTCSACAALLSSSARGEAALRLLREAPLPLPPSLSPRLLAASRDAARRTRTRRSLRETARRLWAPVAACAVTAAVLYLVQARPVRLQEGSVLEAVGSPLHALLPSGATVTLEYGRAELGAIHAEERLLLARGAIALTVPRLPAGRSLAVVTADARVVVHGTQFRVAAEPGGTSVTVSEGRVEVAPTGAGRPSIWLGPGERTDVVPLPEHRRRLMKEAQAALGRNDVAVAGERLAAFLSTDPPSADAAQAHALGAWSRLRQGDRSGAVEGFRVALSLLPVSERPLWADDACSELALLREGEDPLAWQEYLARFPDGVQAAMARARLSRLAPPGP